LEVPRRTAIQTALVLLAGLGVLVGALFAGRALRSKRLGANSPYEKYEHAGEGYQPDGEDYAVGV
jgi:hypothetical protein